MTTIAVDNPKSAWAPSDHSLMNECIRVTTSQHGVAPSQQDAWRIAALRRAAIEHLKHSGYHALTDDAALIITELLTNALLHSGSSTIRLCMGVQENLLNILVHDGVPGVIRVNEADDNAECGRGLTLVAALVQAANGDWGTDDHGASVWCHLPVAAGEGS
ncbi:ATP-binding protein [Streptomyces vinaceus]